MPTGSGRFARERVAESPDDKDRADKLALYEKWLRQLRVAQTRLYVIDAGLDRAALAKKYADRDKYLFLRGDIGMTWKDGVVTGRIKQLYARRIHVPLPYSQQLSALVTDRDFYLYNKQPIPPRYRVRINTGRLLEPWVESVSPLAGERPGR
ncbi:MAG: DUF4824 family protein [Gammaproteobacteria bacterium]